MAYSPSPLAIAGHNHFNHHSASPPLHHPISKREKRRNVMEERFTQISSDFNENRDLCYRRQFQAFQIDIDFIRHADLYSDKPLDDTGDYAAEDHPTSAAASIQEGIRIALTGNTPLKGGKYAAEFTKAINDAMEQRDADLTTVAYRHNFRVKELLTDNDFDVSVAHQEHRQLAENLRQRLIQNVKAKKAALQKEKEKLDIADTNALLFHPNQFSLNSAASPGGPQSNRKTRHTRHRLEVDDLDTANGGGKRKRKAPAEADNGSPVPANREAEPGHALKEANAKLEYHQVTTPLYSLDRLFSQRELDMNLQLATLETVDDWKRRKMSKDTHTHNLSIPGPNVDSSDTEENADASAEIEIPAEDMFPAAPEMERIPTNASQHLTRSTRGLIPIRRITGPESLGYLAGRAAGAAYIGTVGQKEKRREEEYQRAPPLTELEVDDDFAMMKAAMDGEDNGGADYTLLNDVVDETEDHVGKGNVEGNLDVT